MYFGRCVLCSRATVHPPTPTQLICIVPAFLCSPMHTQQGVRGPTRSILHDPHGPTRPSHVHNKAIRTCIIQAHGRLRARTSQGDTYIRTTCREIRIIGSNDGSRETGAGKVPTSQRLSLLVTHSPLFLSSLLFPLFFVATSTQRGKNSEGHTPETAGILVFRGRGEIRLLPARLLRLLHFQDGRKKTSRKAEETVLRDRVEVVIRSVRHEHWATGAQMMPVFVRFRG